MSVYNIDEIQRLYQSLVDDNILTLETAQSMFNEHINDIIVETKKEIDEAFDSNLISAYEKNICYINIGLDVEESYTDVISNLIESKLSELYDESELVEEKRIDPRNIPTKEEYYKKLAEKQAKKEKRKNFFKKVGTAALAAGVIAGGTYLADKAEKSSNARKVVRADNAEYAELFADRDKKLKELENKYQAALKRASTNVEKADLTNQYNANVKSVYLKFNKDVSDYQGAKNQIYATNRAKEQERYNAAMQRTTDPQKRADYERHHKEVMDKWDIHKENRNKARQFSRSDYYKNAELNAEDPDNYRGLKWLGKKLTYNKKAEKINNKYSDYNRRSIH